MDADERREEREAIHRFVTGGGVRSRPLPPGVDWVEADWEQIGDDPGTGIRLSHAVRIF